jgi:hypothetical protein
MTISISITRFLMNNALERNDLGDLLYAYVAAVVMSSWIRLV